MNKKTSLTHGAILVTLTSFVFMAAGYILNIWIGRNLGPQQYGIYGVVIALWTIINLILVSGFPTAVSKYIASDEDNSEAILKTGLILQLTVSLFFACIYYFLAVPISQLLHDLSLTPYIRLTAFIFPAYSLYALYTGYYNGLHWFGRQARLGIIYSLAKLLGVVIFVYFFQLHGVFYSFIIAPVIATGIGFHFPGKTKETFPAKKIITFSLPLIIFTILLTLMQSTDLLFVKAYIHIKEATGYYTAASNVALIPFIALNALTSILFPGMAKHTNDQNKEKIRTLVKQALRFMFLLLTPSVILLSATSKEVIRIIYSPVYDPAALPLSVLIIGYGCLTIFSIIASLLNGAGRSLLSVLIAIGSLLITVLCCVIFIPAYSLLGAAFATTAGALFSLVIGSFTIFYLFKVFLSFFSFLRIFSASYILYLIISYINVSQVLLPFFYLFLISIYILLLTLMKEITSKEWKEVRSVLRL